MALTKDDLVIGNIVYQLVVNNNAIRRDKITMVDDAGVVLIEVECNGYTVHIRTVSLN
jgi:hypothetical protein